MRVIRKAMMTLGSRGARGRRIARPVFLTGLLSVLFGVAKPVHALSFNLTFDASTATAPADFFTAFNNVVQFYQTTYSDPMTINLNVGWGEINGGALAPGNLGQSLTNQRAVTYASLETALVNDAKTAADAIAVASLPITDPTPGVNFVMSNAEAKALRLLAGNATGIDGWVGFNSAATYTFDPNNRAVAGAFDFIGLASHELTEVMGRYGFGQNGSGGRDSPIDLFRYLTSSGLRDLSATRGVANYFSIDGGVTNINSFNVGSSGDLSDWAGTSLDAYNHSLTLGKLMPTSEGDLTVMDVLGYDRITAVPEPDSYAILLAGLGLMGFIARRRKSGSA